MEAYFSLRFILFIKLNNFEVLKLIFHQRHAQQKRRKTLKKCIIPHLIDTEFALVVRVVVVIAVAGTNC